LILLDRADARATSYSSRATLVHGAVNFVPILPFDARQPILVCINAAYGSRTFICEILALSRLIQQTPFMTEDESAMAASDAARLPLAVSASGICERIAR